MPFLTSNQWCKAQVFPLYQFPQASLIFLLGFDIYICVILRQKIVFEILFPGVLYIYIAIFCDLICVQFGVFIDPLFADPYGLILTPHAFSLQISK